MFLFAFSPILQLPFPSQLLLTNQQKRSPVQVNPRPSPLHWNHSTSPLTAVNISPIPSLSMLKCTRTASHPAHSPSLFSAPAAISPPSRKAYKSMIELLNLDCFPTRYCRPRFLHMYAKCGPVDDAHYVFDEMLDRVVVSWTTMVAGFAKAGLMKDARRVSDEMLERNVVSWTAMVVGYANLGEVSSAREIFNEMLEKNAVSWTTMIVGYRKCGDVRGAQQVFDESCVPDATSWAAMIACNAQNGFSSEAIEMYWK